MFYNNEEENIDTSQRTVNNQFGEINSLVEYVVEDCLDIKDTTPEDEDDDWSDPFKTEKRDLCSLPFFNFIELIPLPFYSTNLKTPAHQSFLSSISLDKSSPPPKTVA